MKKRSLFLLLCALYACISFGYSFKEGGIYYNITSSSNMTVEVTYYSQTDNKYSGTVGIPATVDHDGKTYTVKGIGDYAFVGCTDLKGVNFTSKLITYIGARAFSGCNGITFFSFPSWITSVGNYAFAGCYFLSEIVFQPSEETIWLGYGSSKGQAHGLFEDCRLTRVEINRPLNYYIDSDYGYSPFAKQTSLTDITFGEYVTSIPGNIFYGNNSITSYTVPDHITGLSNYAFNGFTGVKSINLNSNTETIPKYCFAGCQDLTSLILPATVTSVGEYAFSGCTSLASITIPEKVTAIEKGTFQGCTGLTSFTIPNNVNSIGSYAFKGCTSLTGVTFEESEETLSLGYNKDSESTNTLGKGMFCDCPLESVFIGRPLSYKTDKRYGYSPFAYNETLAKAHFGNPVTAIQSYLFCGCKSLSTFQYNSNCKPTAIESYAFAGGCKALTSYDIPETVTSIGNGAFKDCEKLAYIVIKPAVQSIGNFAFNGCSSLTGVTFEESEETLSLGYNKDSESTNTLGKGMFCDCPLESVFIGRPLSYKTDKRYGYSPFGNNETLAKAHFGNPLKAIQSYLFCGCKSLKTLQYNSKCAPTSIDSYAFWCCYSLTETDIMYPESVQTIGDGAFNYCTSLEGYTIPNHIKTVGKYAFQNCEKLKSVVVKPSVQSIGTGAFNGCVSMTGLTFEESEETLSLGYNKDSESTNTLGKGMFFDCPLESVFIGRPLSYKTDKRYGYSPFAYNETLAKAHFGNPVTAIQSYLFCGCKSLDTFQYNSNCKPTAIESYAFAGGCKALTSYDIPETVTSIGNGAFKDCEKLAYIVIKPAVQSIGNFAFNGCVSMTGLTFEESEETLSLGYNKDSESTNTLGKGMFCDCPLESVFIGRTLSYKTDKRYGYSPFGNNETLAKAHFGNPLKAIQSYLFCGCKSLKTLQYNSKCAPTIIDSYAFWCCYSLTETDIMYPESVQTIGDGAFNYCTSLEGYTIPNHIKTVGKYAFQNCEKLKSVVVKPSVQSIGTGAFNGCVSMTGLTFEESEETLSLGYNKDSESTNTLGKGMFCDCPLESVFIGRPLSYKTDKRYGYSPFAYNETLAKAHFGNPVTAIQSYLFCGCKSLDTFQYNSNCKPTAIESYAFAGGCKALTSYDIPETVTSIGNGAFKDCEKLAYIVIKPAVQSIGNFAFNGCVSMTGLTFEESEETLSLGYNKDSESTNTLGKGMFCDCPLESVFIGRTLSYKTDKRYGYSPFAYKETLMVAQFGNSVTRISDNMFLGVSELNSVEINESGKLQSVGKDAFNGCSKLPTPTFPNTVTAFEQGAFKDCVSFTDFDMPENLVSIGSYAFQNCAGLTKFIFPATLTSIGNYAFSGCTGVKEVAFKDGEETLALGYGASKGKAYGLFNDSQLEELYLGRTVSYETKSDYGYSPFYMQEALAKVTIGSKVTALPYCIFYGTAIQEIYIPSSVRTLHSSFANNCQNLKKAIIIGLTPPTTDTNNTLLSNSAEDSKFYVFFPDNYKSAKVWKDYAAKIEACCEIYSDFTYSGDGHVIGYKTDFPIVLDNRDTEAIDAGTYQKRIDVTYTTNGYSIKDVLNYEYTIKKAPLTITAESCSRHFGAENPEFKLLYDGFVNDEDEKVFTKEPTVTTKATIDSPVGEYDIVVSGAEAKNYEISYVNGVFTIIPSQQAVGDVNGDGEVNAKDVVDLVDYMIGMKSFAFSAADVNGDGKVNSADVVMLSILIMKQ